MKRLLFILFLLSNVTLYGQKAKLPHGFVCVTDYIPRIEVDMKDHAARNFVRGPIHGSHHAEGIVTARAPQAVEQVEKEGNEAGLGLKVGDACRPQTAVNHFNRWAKDVE